LLNKFLEKSNVSKIVATTILSLASVDTMSITKYILSRYGLKYMLKYILFVAMI